MSPRGGAALLHAAKAWAWLSGARLRDARRGQGGRQADACATACWCARSSSSRVSPPTVCSTPSWPRCRRPAERASPRAAAPHPSASRSSRSSSRPGCWPTPVARSTCGSPRRWSRSLLVAGGAGWTRRSAPHPRSLLLRRRAPAGGGRRSRGDRDVGGAIGVVALPARRRSPTTWRRRCGRGRVASRCGSPPRGTATVSTTLRPLRRGRFQLDRLAVRIDGRLGLGSRQRRVPISTTLAGASAVPLHGGGRAPDPPGAHPRGRHAIRPRAGWRHRVRAAARVRPRRRVPPDRLDRHRADWASRSCARTGRSATRACSSCWTTAG